MDCLAANAAMTGRWHLSNCHFRVKHYQCNVIITLKLSTGRPRAPHFVHGGSPPVSRRRPAGQKLPVRAERGLGPFEVLHRLRGQRGRVDHHHKRSGNFRLLFYVLDLT